MKPYDINDSLGNFRPGQAVELYFGENETPQQVFRVVSITPTTTVRVGPKPVVVNVKPPFISYAR